MKIVEIKGRIAEDDSIILPPGVLDSMGVGIGDMVHLAYLSHHPVKQLNSYGEFFITKKGIDSIGEPVEAPDTAQLSVPHALLEAAGIPLDGDLDITIGDGYIVIGSDDPLQRVPSELRKLFGDLGISPEVVRSVLEGGGEDE